MSHSKPHTLLGATVPDLGIITAVDPCGAYVLITDADGLEHHRFISQLEHVCLSAPQPFETMVFGMRFTTFSRSKRCRSPGAR